MGPLAKLFMGLINLRVEEFSEANNLRAPTQAGFRSGHCLEDLVLILSTII